MERNTDQGFVRPICFDCKHLNGKAPLKCAAFPDGIPKEILLGENDHTEPLPGQKNDIVFEADSE